MSEPNVDVHGVIENVCHWKPDPDSDEWRTSIVIRLDDDTPNMGWRTQRGAASGAMAIGRLVDWRIPAADLRGIGLGPRVAHAAIENGAEDLIAIAGPPLEDWWDAL